MDKKSPSAVEALIVAVPETAGSALYGMIDVLAFIISNWSPNCARYRLSPFQHAKAWCPTNNAIVNAVKDVPTIAKCAALHMTCPTYCGCRVIRIIPVSQRCNVGGSTAATSFRLNTLGYRKKNER